MTQTVEKVEAPVSEQQDVSAPPRGDWVIAAVLLVFFAFGYILAQEWPHRAALFPQMVSAGGVLFVVLKLVGLARRTMRARAGSLPEQVVAATPASHEEAVGAVDDADAHELDDDDSMEYVFATAGGRRWAEAMAWVAAFFVSFFVLGAYVSVPLFALVYLKVAGRTSWLGAAAYALVTGVLIYVVFAKVVYTPLPTGIIPLPGL